MAGGGGNQQQKVPKNLPKRVGSEAHKKVRMSSWARGKIRKEQRAKAQHQRMRANKDIRRSGGLTPWETARALRTVRRANDPIVQARRNGHLAQAAAMAKEQASLAAMAARIEAATAARVEAGETNG